MKVRLLMIAMLIAGLCGCQRLPKGNLCIETGRGRTIDDRGVRQPRINALAQAQHDACLKILRDVEAMPAGGSNLVGDYMARNTLIGARVRSLVLSARQWRERYLEDGTVEAELWINVDDVLRVVHEPTPN